MARIKKCKKDTIYFRFDMPVNHEGENHGNLTIEGYGCMEGQKSMADIDSIEYEGTEIKPVLELMGGMFKIDAKAAEYVKELFEDAQVRIDDHQLAEA